MEESRRMLELGKGKINKMIYLYGNQLIALDNIDKL